MHVLVFAPGAQDILNVFKAYADPECILITKEFPTSTTQYQFVIVDQIMKTPPNSKDVTVVLAGYGTFPGTVSPYPGQSTVEFVKQFLNSW